MRIAVVAVACFSIFGVSHDGWSAPKGARHQPGAVSTKASKSQKKMTKQEKVRAFVKLVREMGKVGKSCQLKGKKLWGKVQFVTSFPDIKVERVTSFPDLKVEWVTSFPDKCGKWEKVTSFPDFKIQIVTSFPDLKIQEVTSFPGVP